MESYFGKKIIDKRFCKTSEEMESLQKKGYIMASMAYFEGQSPSYIMVKLESSQAESQ